MAYTSITEIVAPSKATAGSTVPVTVKVKNIDTVAHQLWLIVVFYDCYGEMDSFISKYPLVSAGQTVSYSGSFTMPNCGTIIDAFTYYPVGAEWIFDNRRSKDVDLVAAWSVIGSDISLAIHLAPTIRDWQIIGSDISLTINISPVVRVWQVIGSDISFTIHIAPTVRVWQIIGDDISLTVHIVAPPIPPDEEEEEEEEEKEFPWLPVALIGGGVALVAASAKPKKIKT